jgi:protein TonB
MSSASLAVPRHAHPDSARIAALSAAIAINFVALLAVMRPMAPQWIEQMQHIVETQIRIISPPIEQPPPPPIDLKKIEQPKIATPRPHTESPRVAPPVAIPTDEGNISAPVIAPGLAPGHAEPMVDASPVEATLAYRAVPLKYPPQALRTRMQGTVILKVLVDEKGAPQDVTVEQSSGYTLLDRSAREQVLQSWKFEPAVVNGHSVRAWARVPVTFNLNEL